MFFRIRNWSARFTTLVLLILTIFLNDDFAPIIGFFNPDFDLGLLFQNTSIVYFILSLLTFIAFFVLLLTELAIRSRSVLGQGTSIMGLIIVSVLGVFVFLWLPSNLNILLLLVCLIVYAIIGSVKTTNSYATKDKKIRLKNIICNIILILSCIAMTSNFFALSRSFYVIPLAIILVNSLLDIFLAYMNSSQKYRPFLGKQNINRKDYLAIIINYLRDIWKSIASVLSGIFVYLLISTVFIFTIFMFNSSFGETAFVEKPAVLNALFGFQILLLGLVVFFEILIHIPLKRLNESTNANNNSLLIFRDLKLLYKNQRPNGLKTTAVAFLGSLFLIIGTIFMVLIFNNAWGNDFLLRLGFYGIHLIRFIKVIIFPFIAIIFCFVVIILLIGLFSGGWVAKNPISGLLSGSLTGMFFSIWVFLLEIGQPKQYALVVIALVLCPIFGALAGFLNWFGRGLPGLNRKRKKTESKENEK